MLVPRGSERMVNPDAPTIMSNKKYFLSAFWTFGTIATAIGTYFKVTIAIAWWCPFATTRPMHWRTYPINFFELDSISTQIASSHTLHLEGTGSY